MTYVLIYLLCGIVNVVIAHMQGILMLDEKARTGEGLWFLAEAAFYLLLWPIQVLFWMLVGINAGTGWILERIFR